MERLCQIYKKGEFKIALEQNIKYHCSDEKTAIQAIERKIKAMQSASLEKRENNYIRHGTQTLIASRCVNTGQIDAYSIGQTRKEEDYLAHVKQIYKTDSKAKHFIICDQLNTHKSASLVEYIASLEGIENLGIKGKSGILKSMKSRMEFLENKEHKISFIFLPKHCSWLNQIENWFGLLQRRVLKRGNFTSISDLKNKINAFIKYYNQYYAKPYIWGKSAKSIINKFKS